MAIQASQKRNCSLAPKLSPLDPLGPRQPPWEELIRQQAELGQLQKKLQQIQRHKQLQQQQQQQQQLYYQQQQTQQHQQQQCYATDRDVICDRPVQRQLRPATPSTGKTSPNMAAYLLCLTAGGGVPLFTRKKGDLKALPFPVIGSINGVHMFARTKDVTLLSTCTKNVHIVWNVFHDSIMLIMVTGRDTTNATEAYLHHLLQLVFDAMVLVVGLDDLLHMKNVERLKRDLRCSYQLIDTILDQTDVESCLFGPMTRTVDCILTSHYQILQNCLEAFVESTDSTYGCLHVNGRIAVATKKWWTFSPREISLLSLFMNSSPKTTLRDVPVFLPVESPTVPHRLLTFALLPGVEVCVLCGPVPTLSQLEKEVVHYWKNSYTALKSISQSFPSYVPNGLKLDKNLLCFMLINIENHRSVYSEMETDSETTKMTTTTCCSHRKSHQESFRMFFRSISGTVFQSQKKEDSEPGYKVYHTRLKHEAFETYVCSDNYKGYALNASPYHLYALYNVAIPTFALRSRTQQLLTSLTQDKRFHL